MRLKYNSVRTWSPLCQRTFASRAECVRGEELCLLEKAEEIVELEYQFKFVLSEKPKITITLDFSYFVRGKDGAWVSTFEDTKGVLTRDTRTKLAWLKEKYGVEVLLSK